MLAEENQLSHTVIGAAIEVHRNLGPGLLESAYQECLACEFMLRGIRFEKEKPLRVIYKSKSIDCAYRLDFFFFFNLIVEL